MLIPLQELLNKYGLAPKGVIHVGAHWAEEHEDYLKCGIERFVYIEPCEPAVKVLYNKFNIPEVDFNKVRFNRGRNIELNVEVIQCACGSIEDTMVMYMSHQNQGQSNSLLKPMLHLEQHPEIVFNDAKIVEVKTLDSIIENKKEFSMLVMDCQGFEGEVIKGATDVLQNIDVIYTECNRGQTYAGNMEIEEMDFLLDKRGFIRCETYWPSGSWTWGDCLFVRKTLINA